MKGSMASPLRTLIRDLHRRRGRERRGLVLAEGVRLVEEALEAGLPLRGVAISAALEGTSRGRALKSALERVSARVEPVSDAELEELADTEHPQGVVAVVEPRSWSLDDIAAAPGSPVVVLDGVQDPGNVGTILRSSLGLGASGVVALKGTAELGNPKVVRGSMGASFRLPAVAADAETYLSWARGKGIETWVSAADGRPLESGPRDRGPAIGLVVGNEGAGVSQAIEAAADRRVAIRLARGVESLNVAVATAILLRELASPA
jgi:RNA methyltransferase, TrmH family